MMLKLIYVVICLVAFYKNIQAKDKPQDMFKQWSTSQALIYYIKPKRIPPVVNSYWDNRHPDCFGTFINELHVLSSASCFIDIESYIDQIDILGSTLPNQITRNGYDISKYIIVQVCN